MVDPIRTQDYSLIINQQPNDTLNSSFDANSFLEIDSILSRNNESLATPIGLMMNAGDNSDLLFNQSSIGNTVVTSSQQNAILDEFDWMNCFEDNLFPSVEQYVHLERDSGPVNEEIITTTTKIENTLKVDDKQLPSDENTKSTDDLENISQIVDRFILESIDKSIQNRTMIVAIQPPQNLHPRYASDGKRQLEKSRTNPMMIKLPTLHEIDKSLEATLLLRLALVTHNEDPSIPTYFHANQLEYHSDNVVKLKDGTVCIPLSENEIEKGETKLPRLAIVKRKLSTYKSELKPFQLIANDEQSNNETEKQYENMSAKDAKKIYQNYNLKASRISCQLLIKKNNNIHGTNIKCETNILEQKNSSRKRTASDTDSEHEEDHNIKRKKTT